MPNVPAFPTRHALGGLAPDHAGQPVRKPSEECHREEEEEGDDREAAHVIVDDDREKTP